MRKQAVRRRPKERPTEAAEDRKRTLWPFRKRSADLDAAEQARLDGVLAYRPARRQADTLREPLTTIFAPARSTADGLRRIRYWRQRVGRRGLRCFDAFLKLLDTWQDRIANDCINRQTRGFVAGLNTKLKVLKRRCSGLRNITRLVQRLTLDLEG